MDRQLVVLPRLSRDGFIVSDDAVYIADYGSTAENLAQARAALALALPADVESVLTPLDMQIQSD